jgi:hypothetical protein
MGQNEFFSCRRVAAFARSARDSLKNKGSVGGRVLTADPTELCTVTRQLRFNFADLISAALGEPEVAIGSGGDKERG